MIGMFAKSHRHLKNSVDGNNLTKVIINSFGDFSLGCLLNVKQDDDTNNIVFFQNILGNDFHKCFNHIPKSEHNRIIKIQDKFKFRLFHFIDNYNNIMDYFSDIIILPNDFFENYNNFCNCNKKLLGQVFDKYCYRDNPLCYYIYSLTENKPNLFVWAITNICKNMVSVYTIFHILVWNSNYNKYSNKLSKGTITAYNGWDKIQVLEKELSDIRKHKRANDAINMFNTFQRKLLKECQLTPNMLEILNKFARLSDTKRINFVKKMSTIDNVDDIFKNMSYLTNNQFNWDKESLINYVNNAENINADIIEDNGDIVLIKVNDFNTVKFLARTTNWCISKNKKYWNDYVELRDNASQYVIFDFSKKEDDNSSIIGFTIIPKYGITNAHNFVNDNLIPDYDDECSMNLNSFIYKKSNNIFNILKKDKINVNALLNDNDLNYEWNKKDFLNFIEKYIDKEDYNILCNNENLVSLIIKSDNTRHLIGKGYYNALGNNDKRYKIIVFADFSNGLFDKDKLLWGIIEKNIESHEEFCSSFFDIKGHSRNKNINDLLSKYDIPFDSICRVYNKTKVFISYLSSLNIKEIDLCLKDINLVNDFIKSKYFNTNIASSALYDSLLRYDSFDFINTIYNNGYKLNDIINSNRMISFISVLVNSIGDMYYDNDCHIINNLDIKNFKNNSLNESMSRYVGYFEALKLISKNETNDSIFSGSINNFFYGDKFLTKLLSPILANHINPNELQKQKHFFDVVLSHECEDAIKIIISKNPSKEIINYILNSANSDNFKNKVIDIINKNVPSFSFS